MDGHLLPGLNPKGVPRELKSSTLTFEYNKIEQLEQLIAQHDIGVIKMEVSRNEEPKHNFLQKVRELASANGIVLIFDECSSGFRQSFGGLHKIYNVEPDMAIFGKALGMDTITAVMVDVKSWMRPKAHLSVQLFGPNVLGQQRVLRRWM